MDFNTVYGTLPILAASNQYLSTAVPVTATDARPGQDVMSLTLDTDHYTTAFNIVYPSLIKNKKLTIFKFTASVTGMKMGFI